MSIVAIIISVIAVLLIFEKLNVTIDNQYRIMERCEYLEARLTQLERGGSRG